MPLRDVLTGAEISTVETTNLKGFKNGALVAAADNAFDVLITADKNLRYQQNLATRRIAIIELPFNSWKRLQSLIPVIQRALETIKPGQYFEIPATPRII